MNKTGFAIAALLGLASVAVQAQDATTVLGCMQANVPTSLRVQDVEFGTSDGSGTTSTLKGRVYAERERSRAASCMCAPCCT